MQLYLMSQGQWPCVTKSPPIGSTIMTKGDDDKAGISSLTNADEIVKWDENNTKAVGNICLRLHHTISYQFNDEESAKTLWGQPKERYGQPGPSRIFLEFKGAMDTIIPNNQDPSPAINKILSHFTRLREANFEIPQKIQVLMLVSKVPRNMESIIQLPSASGKEKLEDKKALEEIIKAMCLSYETSRRTGTME